MKSLFTTTSNVLPFNFKCWIAFCCIVKLIPWNLVNLSHLYFQDLLVDLMQLIFTKKKSESKISWMIWKSWQTKLKKAKLKEALFCAMKKQMKTTQQTLSFGNLLLHSKSVFKSDYRVLEHIWIKSPHPDQKLTLYKKILVWAFLLWLSFGGVSSKWCAESAPSGWNRVNWSAKNGGGRGSGPRSPWFRHPWVCSLGCCKIVI